MANSLASVDRLRQLRLRSAYVVRRLKASPKLAVLSYAIEARHRSIEHHLQQADALEAQEIEVSARLSACRDAKDASGVSEATATIGILRADRTRLDARVHAEISAYQLSEQILWIRASVL